MDIKFYGTENINLNTKVSLLHHTLYNNDYILSNIIVEGKEFLTIQELYDLSPIHKKWIKVNEIQDEGQEEKKEFHRERKEYHYDKAKYHEEKENQ